MSAFLRKYGTAATVAGIPLITRSSMDFKASPTIASGDVKISIDGGALANLSSTPAESTAGSALLVLNFTSSEMAGARIAVKLVDQTTNKEWEDQAFIIETYGSTSGQYTFDLGASLNDIADAFLKRDMSTVSGEAARSPLNALRFLRNKWTVSTGGTLTVYKEDDSTAAWTATVTADTGASPITANDPA